MNTASQSNAADYGYRHVTPKVLFEDLGFSDDAPRPGDPLPSFDLPLTDGGRLRSDDLLGGKPVLFVTGSFTCPMTASSNPLLKDLHSQFGRDVDFVMLHVREAHPGEQREQARSPDEKMRHARDLKQRDRLPWTIAVDDPQGTLHRALDEKPNAAYLIDRSGLIVFRSLWAGDESGLRMALQSVARGEHPDPNESQRRLMPMARGIGAMREMLQHSGPRAKRDLWRSAPPMAVVAWLADLYRPLRREWRTFAAMATLGVATAAVISIIRRTGKDLSRQR
ncbi:MAG: redoxin domain-containing protein [Methylibium sp.]|nr:redoxin domain-containing protein [Methylibium sp.]